MFVHHAGLGASLSPHFKSNRMAKGRVGGTKAKISGQVGTNIYQIRKNSNGTYSQISYVKGVRTETETSEKLQVQRMVTCMVESLMHDIKPVAQLSMQAAKNKTNSMNAFSSMNLRYVAQDCKANWYDSKEFVYPLPSREWGRNKDLGGLYRLSSGTGTINHFSRCFTSASPQLIMEGWTNPNANFVGLEFLIPEGCATIGDYLRKARITRLDLIVFCAFHFWLEQGGDDDDGAWLSRHEYVIMRLSSLVSDNSTLDIVSLRALFSLQQSDDIAQLYWGKDNRSFYLGVQEDLMRDDNYFYGGAFTISYLTGKKLITDSHYDWLSSVHGPWLANQNPADVFGYWMNTPWIDPYPDPFNPPLYRFIDYVKPNSNVDMYIDYDISLAYQTIEVDFQRVVPLMGYLVQQSHVKPGRFILFNSETVSRVSTNLRNNRGSGSVVRFGQANDLSRMLIKVSGNDSVVTYYLNNDLISTNNHQSWLIPSMTSGLNLFYQTGDQVGPKLYGLKVYDTATGEMRVNLRPAIRLADHKYGLYDEVRDIFFTHPALTGA